MHLKCTKRLLSRLKSEVRIEIEHYKIEFSHLFVFFVFVFLSTIKNGQKRVY